MVGSQPEAQNGVEAVLITKPASCNTGAGKAQTDGVLTLTTKRLRWQPNNAAAAQPISLQTSSIVSAHGFSTISGCVGCLTHAHGTGRHVHGRRALCK
jgi:hypothetical protein